MKTAIAQQAIVQAEVSALLTVMTCTAARNFEVLAAIWFLPGCSWPVTASGASNCSHNDCGARLFLVELVGLTLVLDTGRLREKMETPEWPVSPMVPAWTGASHACWKPAARFLKTSRLTTPAR